MGNPKQKWTAEEEEALRAGVRKHGTGKWKDIQKDPEFNPFLSSRSNIDLKDKWRNLNDKWRNMSVSGGMGGVPREQKRVTKPRDVPPTIFNIHPTPAPSTKREPSVKREPKGDPGADESPPEAKTDPKTAPLYDALIFEALSNSTDPNGLETGAFTSYIEQRVDKKNELKFRKTVQARLRRLCSQEKLEKVKNNCYRVKSNSSGDTKAPLTPKQNDAPQAPKQNDAPPAPKHNDVQLTQLQSPTDAIPYGTVEDAAVAAAFKIAEAENKSFVAAEAVKESERVSQMFEDTNSLLQLAEEFLRKCSQGELLMIV